MCVCVCVCVLCMCVCACMCVCVCVCVCVCQPSVCNKYKQKPQDKESNVAKDVVESTK